MGTEIERRFLVHPQHHGIHLAQKSALLRQGCLHKAPYLRVRQIHGSERSGELTVKGEGTFVRSEFNMTIDFDTAGALLASAQDIVVKRRFFLPISGALWTVDVYGGALEGLVTTEIELKYVDQPYSRPYWALVDVTEEKAYTAGALGSMQMIPTDYLSRVSEGDNYLGMEEGAAKILAEMRGLRFVVGSHDGYVYTTQDPFSPGTVYTTVVAGRVATASVYR